MLVWVNKPIGLSPKDCTDKLKKENVKVGFAGRLDPLAYGLLPLVINDKGAVLQSSVMNKDKVYQFKMICGLSSTTFDILGRVTLLDHVSTLLSFVTHFPSQQAITPELVQPGQSSSF